MLLDCVLMRFLRAASRTCVLARWRMRNSYEQSSLSFYLTDARVTLAPRRLRFVMCGIHSHSLHCACTVGMPQIVCMSVWGICNLDSYNIINVCSTSQHARVDCNMQRTATMQQSRTAAATQCATLLLLLLQLQLPQLLSTSDCVCVRPSGGPLRCACLHQQSTETCSGNINRKCCQQYFQHAKPD